MESNDKMTATGWMSLLGLTISIFAFIYCMIVLRKILRLKE